MPDQEDTPLEPLRQSLAPDPAAVDRVIEGALASRKPPVFGLRFAAVGVLVIAGAAALFWTRPSASLTGGSLSNQGDIYVSRSPAGVWIHNNPQPESATFQMISTGDSQ